jgi:hypothetical protein
MINELERVSREAVVAYLNIPSRYLPRGTEENYKKTVCTACQYVDIWTQVLANTKQDS